MRQDRQEGQRNRRFLSAVALLSSFVALFIILSCIVIAALSVPLLSSFASAISGTGGTITMHAHQDSVGASANGSTITISGIGGMRASGTFDIATITGRLGVLDMLFTQGNFPPVITQSGPGDGTLINTTAISLNYTVTDINADLTNCTLFAGTANPPAGAMNTSYDLANGSALSYLFSSLNETTYYWNVNCTDGQASALSTTRNLSADLTPPSVRIVSPQNITYTNASVFVNLSSINASSVWFYNGTGNETYSVPVTRTYAQGQTLFTAYANDSAGNANASTIAFAVDSVPPMIVTNLTNISSTNSSITWNWTNPADADFNGTDVFIDGVAAVNLSASLANYTASGFLGNTSHTISVYTKDINGNINTTNVSSIVRSVPTPDLVAPGAVRNLSSINQTNVTISWNWTNPADADFNGTDVFIDGVAAINLSLLIHNYTAAGFSPNTSHMISVYTIDLSGNLNATNVSNSNRTVLNPDIIPPAFVTGLVNASATNITITWSWANPVDADFNGTNIFIDGVAAMNLSAANTSYVGSGFSANTSHTITVYTRDLSGNINITNVSNSAWTLPPADITPPAMLLISPANNSGTGSSIVTFVYNASDLSLIPNCSLYFNGTLNQTNSSIVSGALSSFNVAGLSPATYSWNISCTDASNNVAYTQSLRFSVILETSFDGNTTDLSKVNISSVPNLTLEKSGKGKIIFNGTIDLSGGSDIDRYVSIGQSSISINSTAMPALNRSATLSFSGFPYQFPIILQDGALCSDCAVSSLAGQVITFNVTHFSNYTATASAALFISDTTETTIVKPGAMVTFSANYSNVTSGLPILGNCTISFNIPWTVPDNMTYNSTNGLYIYNRTFTTPGTYFWNVSCFPNPQEFDNLSTLDTFLISPTAIIGGNYQNVTIITQVNVTNTKPEILFLSVYDSLLGNPVNVTLTAGNTRLAQCNATLRDRNGMDGSITLNATLFHQSVSAPSADDNSTHYTTSCFNVTPAYGQNGWYKNYTCNFNVWYYANNGTWNCSVQAFDMKDGFNYSVNATNQTRVNALYALNVTDGIDYGDVSVGENSSTALANITNFGNRPINVSLQGYGTQIGDGFAMVCNASISAGNISISSEAFSLNLSANFTQMTALTGAIQPILNLTIAKPTDATRQLWNSTAWQLFINTSQNPNGVCTGNVIFMARAS